MTHAKNNSKSPTPKVQLKYLPKDVLKVMNALPRDPILDLMESSGQGRNFASPEPILRAYYLSRLPESSVPEKPHAVRTLLKENWMKLADLCGFVEVPCWETFRVRFKLLAGEYGNETTMRLFEIKKELEKRNIGKKALPIIAKHRQPRRRGQEDSRSNYRERKERIGNSLSLFALIDAAGTEEMAERFFIKARWPDGRPRCPSPACDSVRVVEVEEEAGEQLRRWVCLECEERFDIKTGTTFEGTRTSLRTILWTAYLMVQIPFGMPSLDLACLLEEEGRRLSHKDAVDITHRMQTALVERLPIFDGPAQYDTSLMGYASDVEVHVQSIVDVPTRQVRAEVNYGPVTKAQAERFIYTYLKENGGLYTDSTKACPDGPFRQQVNHSKGEFARDGEREGERVATNLDENFWSTLQEMLDRRRSISARYFPLYLAEHMWRYNHRSESTFEQLQAVVRNSRDVVLNGDDKPCDAREVEDELGVQLVLHPPHSKEVKARNRGKRSRIKESKDFTQPRLEGD